MHSSHVMDIDPNESFYKSIDREYERNQTMLCFNEFCLSNGYTASYVTNQKSGKYQITMLIKKGNEIRYLKRSMVTDSKSGALYSVIRDILNLAHSINHHDQKKPPESMMGKETDLCFHEVERLDI